MMSTRIDVTLGALVTTVCLLGCGPMNREGSLIGTWDGGGATTMAIKAAKMKADDPGAKGELIMDAARAAANMGIEFRKDKTYTLVFSNIKREGAWTFDKDTGEVVLNIAKTEALDPKHELADQQPTAYTAYLSEDDRRLGFYPIDPASAKTVREMNKKAPFSLSKK